MNGIDDPVLRWDALYRRSFFAATYPSEPVVRWTFRNFSRSEAARTKLLDVGSGPGRHALFFAHEGYKASAVDVSPMAIEQLSQESRRLTLDIDARVAPAEKLPYDDASFDGVLSYGVLYYLTPEEMALSVKEMHRVLRPGGRALVMIKSDADSRRRFATPIAPNRFRIGSEPRANSWSGDIGMTLTLLGRDAIAALFADFADVAIDRITQTSGNGALISDDWHVHVRT